MWQDQKNKNEEIEGFKLIFLFLSLILGYCIELVLVSVLILIISEPIKGSAIKVCWLAWNNSGIEKVLLV